MAVAAVWGLRDVDQAKAKFCAALLTHTPTPSLPKVYCATQGVAAFHLAGYDDRVGVALARLWQSRSNRAAEVRGGGVLVNGGSLLTKFFDVNLTALLTDEPIRDTVVMRILPGALHGDAIVERVAVVERLLDRCEDPEPIPAPTTVDMECVLAELLALA